MPHLIQIFDLVLFLNRRPISGMVEVYWPEENYILKKHKHSFQPLVNKDDIFIPIKKEKFVIDCIKKVG